MLTLRRAPALVVEAPTLDAQQQAALALDAPVARVLGGPGTGTSTVAVEVVLDRVDRLGLTPTSAWSSLRPGSPPLLCATG